MIRAALFAVPALVLLLTAAPAADEKENPIIALVKTKVKHPDKPFSLLVTLKVKAGQEAAFEAAFAPCLAATRKEPGCLAYQLNRDLDHPDTFVMYERFKSLAAIEEHGKTKYVADLLAKIGPMLAGEPQVKVFAAAGD